MVKIFLSLFLFLLLLIEASGQDLLSKEVRLNYQKERLNEIIADLGKRYQLNFAFSNLTLSNRRSINYQGTLEGGLNALFNPERIEYKIIGDQIALKYERYQGQNIRGVVLDQKTRIPLIGANLLVLGTDPLIGTSTDESGEFSIGGLAVGRYDLIVNYLGYESKKIGQVLISTGNGVILNVELEEAPYALKEAIVTAKFDPAEPTNEMASSSARSFSVEETKRYAAAISDPARMVQSFAGVSGGGDDLSNNIIIRGNSSRNLLWRLEGAEIPSPNHFRDLGEGGGAVSMLSSRTLANSDFYTGAFPAEFGNALSGVFDLKLRNGTKSAREYSLSVGTLGAEGSMEGYWKRGSNSSYLVNYRYFTTAFLKDFLPTLSDEKNNFQDISFKLNFPGKNNNSVSIFGLGGTSTSLQEFEFESTPWIPSRSLYTYDEKGKTGVLGISHNSLINDQSYLKSSLVGSIFNYRDQERLVSAFEQEVAFEPEVSRFQTFDLTGSVNYHYKQDAKNYFQTGLSLNYELYNYDLYVLTLDTSFLSFFEDTGNAALFQSFAQWQYRFHQNWKMVSGFNFTHFFLNNTWSLDPRFSIDWNFRDNQTLGLALGLYSKPEHSSTYLIKRSDTSGGNINPNLELALMKSFHFVMSHQLKFLESWRIKTEAYYQYLYNVPVSSDPDSDFSILNAFDVFDVVNGGYQTNAGNNLVSEGTGVNYGLEFTLEKFFSRNYYGLFTLSLFDSKFTNLAGQVYPTFNARNVLFNILGGKEWQIGRRENRILGLNGKFTLNGGNRYTPIDLEASKAQRRVVFIPNSTFGRKVEPYYRFDIGISYKINHPGLTHTFSLDIQNVTNHRNVFLKGFNPDLGIIQSIRQNGLIPFLIYRIEFNTNNTVLDRSFHKVYEPTN